MKPFQALTPTEGSPVNRVLFILRKGDYICCYSLTEWGEMSKFIISPHTAHHLSTFLYKRRELLMKNFAETSAVYRKVTVSVCCSCPYSKTANLHEYLSIISHCRNLQKQTILVKSQKIDIPSQL